MLDERNAAASDAPVCEVLPAATPLARYDALVDAGAVNYVGWRALANELTLAALEAPAAFRARYLPPAAACMARADRQDSQRLFGFVVVAVRL